MPGGSFSRTNTLCLCGQAEQSCGYQFPQGVSEFTLCRLGPLARCHSLRDRFLSGPFSWVGHIAKYSVLVYSLCSGHNEGALGRSSVCRLRNCSHTAEELFLIENILGHCEWCCSSLSGSVLL